MEAIRRNISLVIAAALAFALQLVVTPAMTIALIRPNALLAFCVVLAMVRPANSSMVAAFVLGLLGGALSSHPIGLMAAIMVVVSFALIRVFSVLDGSSQIMAIACIAIAVLVAELAYGLLLIQFGMGVSFLSLLMYRIAPCALYDCILAFLMYPLVHRFVGPQVTATHIPVAQQLR